MNNVQKAMPVFNINDTFIYQNSFDVKTPTSSTSLGSATLRQGFTYHRFHKKSLKTLGKTEGNMLEDTNSESPRKYYFLSSKVAQSMNTESIILNQTEENDVTSSSGIADFTKSKGFKSQFFESNEASSKKLSLRTGLARKVMKNLSNNDVSVTDFFSSSINESSNLNGIRLPPVVKKLEFTEPKKKYLKSTEEIAANPQKANSLMVYLDELNKFSNRKQNGEEATRGSAASYIFGNGKKVLKKKKVKKNKRTSSRSPRKRDETMKSINDNAEEEEEEEEEEVQDEGKKAFNRTSIMVGSPIRKRVSILAEPENLSPESKQQRDAHRKATFRAPMILSLFKGKGDQTGGNPKIKGRHRSRADDRLLFNSRNSRATVTSFNNDKLIFISENFLENIRNLEQMVQNPKKLIKMLKKLISSKKNLKDVLFPNGNEERINEHLSKELIVERCFIKEPAILEGQMYFKERFDQAFLNDLWYLNEEIQNYLISRDISSLKNMEEKLRSEYFKMREMENRFDPKLAKKTGAHQRIMNFKTIDGFNYQNFKVGNPLHDEMEKFERQFGECQFVNMKSRLINKALEDVINNLKKKL